MSGRFRRAIRLDAGPGVVEAEVEDDFHHFAVRLRHDGLRVTGAGGRAIRHPWSLCPMAADALPQLAGLAIGPDATAAYRHLDPLGQCTHMLELAALAVAQAARGGSRRYDVSVSDPRDGVVEAELLCDGRRVALYRLEGGMIQAPPDLAGERPTQWRSLALAALAPAEAERRLILRRAIGLAAARDMDVDRFATAADMGRGRACYVFSPGVAERALRRQGSERDFSDGPGPLAHAPSHEEAR